MFFRKNLVDKHIKFTLFSYSNIKDSHLPKSLQLTV